MVATHSPYILNYLNVLLHRPTDSPTYINPDNIAVYRIANGSAHSLVARDSNGSILVDTYDLTEDMNHIYDEYCSLCKV